MGLGLLHFLEGDYEAAIKEIEEDPNSPALVAEVPLKLAFSVLRVKRDDPAERMFVSMILNAEEELGRQSDPIVLPIIGRGRALWPLTGKDLNDEEIFQAASSPHRITANSARMASAFSGGR